MKVDKRQLPRLPPHPVQLTIASASGHRTSCLTTELEATIKGPHGNGSDKMGISQQDMCGWVRIAACEHQHLPDAVHVYHSQALTEWYTQRPHLRMRCIVPVQKEGTTVELHSWYDQHLFPPPSPPDNEQQGSEDFWREPFQGDTVMSPKWDMTPRPTGEDRNRPPMPTEVHGLVAKDFSKEYIYEIVQDALTILPKYMDRKGCLVVVNSRKIAVILDKEAWRTAVIPADLLLQVAEGPMKTRLQTYLDGPPQAYYHVMHMAGGYFPADDASK